MARFLVMAKLAPEARVKLGKHHVRAEASRAAFTAVGAVEECAYYAVSPAWDQVGIISAPSRDVLMQVLEPVAGRSTSQRVEVIELLTADEAEAVALAEADDA